MPHDHHHPHEAHAHRPALRWSLLRASAGQRLGLAGVLLALLWLATRWALT